MNPHMMGILQTLFVGFRAQLVEDKLISEDVVYIDGTKLEANANKYTFQWIANIERFSQSVVEKSNTLYETLVAEEIIPEIKKESSEELSKEEMNQIETYLENKEKNLTSQIENMANTQERKILRKQRTQIKKSKKAINDFRERKIKYENQKEIYGDRLKNFTWEFLKNYTKQLLSDPKMNGIYKKRKIDVESAFGNLKANLGFKRLSVRTQSKVECEIGIALMALNIRKIAR